MKTELSNTINNRGDGLLLRKPGSFYEYGKSQSFATVKVYPKIPRNTTKTEQNFSFIGKRKF